METVKSTVIGIPDASAEAETMLLPKTLQVPSTLPIGRMAVKVVLPSMLVVLTLILLWQIRLPAQIMEEPLQTNQSEKCLVPAYSEHGTYILAPASKPGENLELLNLTVTCVTGYGVLGTENVYCQNGSWSDSVPECVPFCKLDNHKSVYYHCIINSTTKDTRTCNAYEPPETVVSPKCNSPNYYSRDPLPYMRCNSGIWDRVVLCSSECGRVSKGMPLMTDGRSAEQGELPWHVGIYRKNMTAYIQICGGSIISDRLVISAAHCFWGDFMKLRNASEYAVAAGKIYRDWNNSKDVYAQKSDIKEIKIPPYFQGAATNFQADIAIIILEISFVFNAFVRPICLDFDVHFDRRQLQPGKLGKVGGWGFTTENGNASEILQVVDLPYVGIEECYAKSPETFKEYISIDKICAGYGNGTTLCRGDSGGGLAFPESERGTERFYLRGIPSTAPTNVKLCNTKAIVALTHIQSHERFVKEYL